MTNPNLRETIRTAFQNSGLTVADFDNELSSTLDDVFEELYREEETNTATCGIDCMSLPWDSFFDNIIFPYITTQIPECKDLANLSHDDKIYQDLRSETKTFFISIGELHSLLCNSDDKNPLSALLSSLLR